MVAYPMTIYVYGGNPYTWQNDIKIERDPLVLVQNDSIIGSHSLASPIHVII